jgi:hypothetical protein
MASRTLRSIAQAAATSGNSIRIRLNTRRAGAFNRPIAV